MNSRRTLRSGRQGRILPVLVIAATCSTLTLLIAQGAARIFSPPSTAVVDIYKVFEGYDKKRDVEIEMRAKAEAARATIESLEGQLKEIEAELKLVTEGSEAHRALIIKRTELALDANKHKKKVRDEFRQRHQAEVTKIRDEISRELKRFGEAHELNLILEKTFYAEMGEQMTLNWPIIHFASPEIDITDEMIEILNSKENNLSKKPGEGNK
jgi:Skp family chaperone for outer membrane proteins